MELTYQTIIRLNLCAWPPKSINNLHFIDYYFIDRRRNRPYVKNDELKNDDRFRKMKHDRKNKRKLFVKLCFALKRT